MLSIAINYTDFKRAVWHLHDAVTLSSELGQTIGHRGLNTLNAYLNAEDRCCEDHSSHEEPANV